MYEPIAIIGLAGRFAGSPDLDTFWQDIASGRDLVRPFPQSRIKELEEASGIQFREEIANGGYLDTISQFEPEYFNISPEECKYIDPQQRLVLELTEEAIQSTGIGPGKLAESGVGVFMASSINTYALGIGSMPMGVANSSEAAMAGRVSYVYNFSGPSLTVNTESSSVAVALHYACVSLQQQECNTAVVGGGRILGKEKKGGTAASLLFPPKPGLPCSVCWGSSAVGWKSRQTLISMMPLILSIPAAGRWSIVSL